jgi:predicted PurR-regulated permease PerM
MRPFPERLMPAEATERRPAPSVYEPSVQRSASRVRSRRARITIGVLAAGVAWASLPFLAGLMGAVVLAVLGAPAHRRLAPTLGTRRAAFLLAVVFSVLLVAPIALVLATVMREAPSLLQSMLASAAFARLGELRIGPLDIGAQITEAGRNVVSWGSGRAMAAAGSVTRAVLNLLLAVVGVYYLLPDGPALWRRLRGFIPFSAEGSDRIAERFASITEAAVLGIVATALTQGVTVGLGFWLVGLPNPVLWGGVTGLVSILPILGSSIVWVPAVAVLALDQRAGAALALGLIGAIISSNVDNVIRPVIYQRVSGLHPMASLLGAFAGMELFGLLGLVLGPLAIAYCLELVQLYEAEYPSSAAAPPRQTKAG